MFWSILPTELGSLGLQWRYPKRKNYPKTQRSWCYFFTYLGGGFKYLLFSPYLQKIPILTNIFQMGWNHQFIAKCTCNFFDEYNQVIQVVTWTLSPVWRFQDRRMERVA